jgi:hypothetical protein
MLGMDETQPATPELVLTHDRHGQYGVFHVKREQNIGGVDGEVEYPQKSGCGGHLAKWWRTAGGSGSLGRLSVCRIPASTFNTCTTLLLQKYCSRFSPKEVG